VHIILFNVLYKVNVYKVELIQLNSRRTVGTLIFYDLTAISIGQIGHLGQYGVLAACTPPTLKKTLNQV
jgi:hypothetical protein